MAKKEQKDNHEAVVVTARVLLSALTGAANCRDGDAAGQRICGTCWGYVDDCANELHDALAGEGLQETVANPADTIQ